MPSFLFIKHKKVKSRFCFKSNKIKTSFMSKTPASAFPKKISPVFLKDILRRATPVPVLDCRSFDALCNRLTAISRANPWKANIRCLRLFFRLSQLNNVGLRFSTLMRTGWSQLRGRKTFI